MEHLTLTHWGAYTVRMQDGRVGVLDPLTSDPDPSPIGQSVARALDDGLRIAQPMVREGYLRHGPNSRTRRGQEPFVPVSWKTADQLVADEITRVSHQYGNAAIFGGSYGWASAGRFHHAQGQLHRFLNLCGGYTRSVNTYSYAAAEVLLPHVIGNLARIIHEKCAIKAKPLISFTTMRMGCLMKFFAMKSLAQVFGGLGRFRAVR